jgi:hypothetical protein
MAIWGCGSPACCWQPAVAGGFIYAYLRSELNTHLAPQAMFTSSSPGCDHQCYMLSPFQAHLGRWHCTCFLRSTCLFTAHMGTGSSLLSCGVFLPWALLQAFLLLTAGHVPLLLPSTASLFIYSSHGKWVFPPLLCSFPPTATFTSFLLLIAGRVLLLLPSPAGLWGISPSPSLVLRAPRPLCYVSFLLLLLIIQFLFFPWVGVSLSRGLCWSGPGLSVGVPCTA